MADISMCQRGDCPVRHECYRFMAPPDPYWQSYLIVKKIGKDFHSFEKTFEKGKKKREVRSENRNRFRRNNIYDLRKNAGAV